MAKNNINASISVPVINAYTYPQGPRGVGIKSITQDGNTVTIVLDDNSKSKLTFPDWWFGTRAEYNAMTQDEKNMFELHFIEEGS